MPGRRGASEVVAGAAGRRRWAAGWDQAEIFQWLCDQHTADCMMETTRRCDARLALHSLYGVSWPGRPDEQ